MRHRNMYYMTGLPGWMRFGYSPGWVGRSASGLGPGAEYLTTGQWPTPQMATAWQAMQTGVPPTTGYAPNMSGYGVPPTMGYAPNMYGMANPMGAPAQANPQAQLDMLKQQAQMLSSQLEQIEKQIADLEETD